MTDKYVEKQIGRLAQATSEAEKADILYRVGTHLEVIPCDGNADNARANWYPILDAAEKAINTETSNDNLDDLLED